ncbi:MAG TPA: prepilin-type N-terminal cleavage/methylation domain-containing protein [Fimbriimonas sp.]
MSRKGQTLAAMLIVIVIIAILAAVMYVGPGVLGGKKESPRADKMGNTTMGLSKLQAEDEVCRSNLRQLRSAIQVVQMSEDRFPTSLMEVPSGASMSACPIGKEPYAYDPMSGTVSCPHPGHENY